MKLKKIKLAGFKSFVDPTTITFNSNRVAIVGPNGCGKSNIIDAVRWVMGESSTKQLRAASMNDVIFNGSNSRKPVGQAAVELIFDNTDTTLTNEYAKYTEISIRREVSRDDVSDYYLNNLRCRRRDIVDIFLGTGLGPHSYAIVEQGAITELIAAKPEELRTFLEEAAGISKYKDRRKETESRIGNTRDNLARLQDIRHELESQLNQLKRQSNAANRYKILKQQYRQTRAYLEGLHFLNTNNQFLELEQSISIKETAIEQKLAELTKLNTLFVTLAEQRTEATAVFNGIQTNFYNLGAEISRIEQQITNFKDRKIQLTKDLQQIQTMLQEITQHTTKDQQTLGTLQHELTNSESEINNVNHAVNKANDNLIAAEHAMQSWQTTWDEFNTKVAQNNQHYEVGTTKIAHLQQNINNVTKHLQKLHNEQTELHDLSSLQEELMFLEEECELLKLSNTKFKNDLADKREQIKATREHCNQYFSTINIARQELQKLQGRYSALEALQQAALGKNNVHANAWLQANKLHQQPRLAQNLQVVPGWELAVETVLNIHLDAICVDNIDVIANLLETLHQGSIALFAAQAPPKTTIVKEKTLADKITSTLPLDSLLTHIYTADNLQQALNLRPSLQPFESVITQNGIWVGLNWVCLNIKHEAKHGILQREQELQQITKCIQDQQLIISQHEIELNKSKTMVNELEQHYELLQHQSNATNTKYSATYGELTTKRTQIDHLQKRSVIITQEIHDQSQKLIAAQEELAASLFNQEQLKINKIQYENQKPDLLITRDLWRNALSLAREQVATSKKTQNELEIKLKYLRTQIQYLTQNLQRTANQTANFAAQQSTIMQSLNTIETPANDLTIKLQVFLQQRSNIDKELLKAKQRVENIEHQLRELDKIRNALRDQEQKMRSELEQVKIAAKALQTRSLSYNEKILELGFELQQIIATIPNNAEISTLEEHISLINSRIDRLGAINLAAIAEYNQKLERKNYLDAQNNDLIEALRTLEGAIMKIDQETKELFRTSYATIDEEFQRFFPIIFGGGKAYLEMTENDLLNTGIVIKAHPPGKCNSTIHLLSGGEKALTAIALVFAMFQLNPAPFCMLDEVDAPLDDNNAIKFCNLVKEMSNKTQFIVVSHNKITMEMAEQLAGITMQEQGVSRLVAVDIEEARSWTE